MMANDSVLTCLVFSIWFCTSVFTRSCHFLVLLLFKLSVQSCVVFACPCYWKCNVHHLLGGNICSELDWTFLIVRTFLYICLAVPSRCLFFLDPVRMLNETIERRCVCLLAHVHPCRRSLTVLAPAPDAASSQRFAVIGRCLLSDVFFSLCQECRSIRLEMGHC